MSEKEIHTICLKYRISNYTINIDMSIDVDGNVNISNKNLVRIPLIFRNVSGNFHCGHNHLTTLIGSPISVGNWFDASCNNLKSLKYITGNALTYYLNFNELPFNTERLSTSTVDLIARNQSDYKIWDDNDIFNQKRFDILINDINNKIAF